MITEAQITAAAKAISRGAPWDPVEDYLFDDARRALEAAEKAAWQPAAGPPPPLHQRVLLCQPGHEPCIGWLTEHGWDFGCSRCGTWVTHYRLLPESPTESF